MLGEKFGEVKGKITAQRLIPNPAGPPKMEVTYRAAGTLLGAEVSETATYTTEICPVTGTIYGEGQALITTKDGEVIAWRGSGVGKPLGKGDAMAWRGCIYYQAQPNSKFARLNGLASVFEFQNDENGECEGHVWEWR